GPGDLQVDEGRTDVRLHQGREGPPDEVRRQGADEAGAEEAPGQEVKGAAVMRLVVLGVVAALASLVAARADDPDPEPPGPDRGKLMGTWEVTGIEGGGMKLNIGALGGGKGLMMVIKFEKDGLTSTGNGMTKKGTWKIDPRKKPRTIDFTTKDDGKTAQGIYK